MKVGNALITYVSLLDHAHVVGSVTDAHRHVPSVLDERCHQRLLLGRDSAAHHGCTCLPHLHPATAAAHPTRCMNSLLLTKPLGRGAWPSYDDALEWASSRRFACTISPVHCVMLLVKNQLEQSYMDLMLQKGGFM